MMLLSINVLELSTKSYFMGVSEYKNKSSLAHQLIKSIYNTHNQINAQRRDNSLSKRILLSLISNHSKDTNGHGRTRRDTEVLSIVLSIAHWGKGEEGKMAKRFTDTDKWGKAKFMGWSAKMKLSWLYLLDNCNHAGIWDVNMILMRVQIGEDITIEEMKSVFGDRINQYREDKIFIQDFIEFQYGTLDEANRAHKSAISILEKEGLYKGLIRSLQGRKDKDKDKDKVKDKEADLDFEKIYEIYPRKVGKTKGLERCKKQIKTEADFQALEKSVLRYKAHCASEATDPKFIMHFATFMNCWRDWTEPETGQTDLRVVESHGWTDAQGNPIDFNREREEW